MKNSKPASKRSKTPKRPKTHKIYLTYSQEHNQFYVGVSCKMGKQYDDYYGSGSQTDSWSDKVKVTLAELDMKSASKLGELCLQIHFRRDPRCINDMLNIRCRGAFLTAFDERPIIQEVERIINEKLRDPEDQTGTS